MSPRRTTEADRHGTRRAARAAKLASIGQTASPRGMKFARRPDEKRTATHTDRPTPAHKPGGLRTQTIFASCVRISASCVYTFASCVCIFATCEYSLLTGPGNFTSHPRRLCPALRRFSPPGRGRRGQKESPPITVDGRGKIGQINRGIAGCRQGCFHQTQSSSRTVQLLPFADSSYSSNVLGFIL